MKATLRDNPEVAIATAILGMDFQVAVLLEHGLPGARASRYLGSVSWGWSRSSGMGDVKLAELTLIDGSGVSADFTTAVNFWNTPLRVTDPAALNGVDHPVLTIPSA